MSPGPAPRGCRRRGAARFDLELGDSAVLLGLNPRFTLADVVANAKRLDRELLGGLVTRHGSGLVVMAGPEELHTPAAFENGDLTKLLYLFQEQYAYVVVDAGPNLGKSSGLLMELAEDIYVVTQPDVPRPAQCPPLRELPAAVWGGENRLVVNRYDSRKHEIDEERIEKTVGVRSPGKSERLRNVHGPTTPRFPWSRAIPRPAGLFARWPRQACGKPAETASRKGFGLFR
jgi:MinD-like ATPase involved in chromosome partitioning or flagellar assembly